MYNIGWCWAPSVLDSLKEIPWLCWMYHTAQGSVPGWGGGAALLVQTSSQEHKSCCSFSVKIGSAGWRICFCWWRNAFKRHSVFSVFMLVKAPCVDLGCSRIFSVLLSNSGCLSALGDHCVCYRGVSAPPVDLQKGGVPSERCCKARTHGRCYTA